MKRRVFLETTGKAAVLASLGLTVACGGDTEDIQPDLGDDGIEIDLGTAPFDALNTQGNWVLHPSENILLVNDNGQIRAFTSVCTHSGCSRNWTFQTEATCTCHRSKFDVEGRVTHGPASRNLSSFDVEVTGDSAVIS